MIDTLQANVFNNRSDGLRCATKRYGVLRATRLQAGGVDRAFISRLLGYGIGNKAYLRGERGPDRDTTLVVACEAAWPGCGRLLLPGPLHLLRATRLPAPLHAYPDYLPHPPVAPLSPTTAPAPGTPPRIRPPISRIFHFAASLLT